MPSVVPDIIPTGAASFNRAEKFFAFLQVQLRPLALCDLLFQRHGTLAHARFQKVPRFAEFLIPAFR